MTQPSHTTLATLGTAALGAFVIVGFLLPRGDSIAYTALYATLFFCAAATLAWAYSQWEAAAEPARDESLNPAVDRYVLGQDETIVPGSILGGAAPLVALVRESEVLHPEFDTWLAPYFADQALAFVQTATHYRTEGWVADAFYAQELLAGSRAAGKNSANATLLRGSGALIAREALRAAYRPGIHFDELGLRLQALGYSSYFESTPLVLAEAPRTLEQYWPVMLRRAVRAFALLFPAATAGGLTLAARLQYFSDAAVYGAAAAGTAALVLAPLMLLVRGASPVIVSSTASLPGLALLAACAGTAGYALSTSGLRVAAPATLALAGIYTAIYSAATLLSKQMKVQVTDLLIPRAVGYYAVLSKVLRPDKLGDYFKRLGNINRIVARNVSKVEDVLLGQN